MRPAGCKGCFSLRPRSSWSRDASFCPACWRHGFYHGPHYGRPGPVFRNRRSCRRRHRRRMLPPRHGVAAARASSTSDVGPSTRHPLPATTPLGRDVPGAPPESLRAYRPGRFPFVVTGAPRGPHGVVGPDGGPLPSVLLRRTRVARPVILWRIVVHPRWSSSLAFLTFRKVLPRRSASGPNRCLSWSFTESSRPCL